MKLTCVVIFCALHALYGVESFTLECEFQNWLYAQVGDVYQCYTDTIPDSSNDTTITAITGTHLEGKTNADIAGLSVEGNRQVSFFPRGASQFFPNLKLFYLRQVGIEALQGDELEEFPTLEWFGVALSKLENISSSLFESNKKISTILFWNNPLQHVGHDLLTPLNISQLERVNFGGNKCIDREADDGNIETIKTIIEEIRVNCLFDDEVRTTTTTTTATTTTSEPPRCYDGPIEDFVCSKIERLERELSITRDLLQEKSNKIGEIESEMRDQEKKFKEELALMREQLEEAMATLKKLKEVFA